MTTYEDDMPIYISIYDKKPRKKHVFIYVLPDEEKRERARDSAKKYYNNNRKEINAKHALYRESVKSQKKKTCFLDFFQLFFKI